MSGDGDSNANASTKQRRRKNRWGDAPPPSDEADNNNAKPSTNGQQGPPDDAKAKALALQESIRQRLAALKSKTTVVAAVPKHKRPLEVEQTTTTMIAHTNEEPPTKKAKHFELDMTVTGPTFAEKPKPKINPYLSIQEEDEPEAFLDERLVRAAKPRKRYKALTFVEPGTFVEIAERKRLKAANAVESGFASGRKAGMYVKAADMAKVYGGGSTQDLEDDDTTSTTVVVPRADANPDLRVPIIEWWDIELLPSKLKKQVTALEDKALKHDTKARLQHLSATAINNSAVPEEEDNFVELQTSCLQQASLSYSKTAALVQHIVPISTSFTTKPPPQPVLYLTKKERKRQRKLRRAEKQRELQDLQAAGLIPPPEPRLTLRNFIKVMGDQAYVDPSQMEKKVNEQMHARQQVHRRTNEANRLTKEQKGEKRARKLLQDSTSSSQAVVTVALFWVKDMSHPYHRAKVELNARQNNITGGVLECENPQMACVICEGGPKAISRYTRLMLVRMKWTGTDNVGQDDDDDDEEETQDGQVKTHKVRDENAGECFFPSYM
jgi:U4/U6 small nuclear ribonucleoprotein PRP3